MSTASQAEKLNTELQYAQSSPNLSEVQRLERASLLAANALDKGLKIVQPAEGNLSIEEAPEMYPIVADKIIPAHYPRLVLLHEDEQTETARYMINTYSAHRFANLNDEPKKNISTVSGLKDVLSWCPYDLAVLDEYGKKIGLKLEHIPAIRRAIKATRAVPRSSISQDGNFRELINGVNKPLRLTSDRKKAVLELFDAIIPPEDGNK